MSPEVKAYYATGKRVMVDGVPCWRPKWWGTLGNDKEYREATRETFNKAHYPEGTIRVVRNGIPYRYPAHVKNWKPANRAALDQGYDRFGLTLRPHNKWVFLDGGPHQFPLDLFTWAGVYPRAMVPSPHL